MLYFQLKYKQTGRTNNEVSRLIVAGTLAGDQEWRNYKILKALTV